MAGGKKLKKSIGKFFDGVRTVKSEDAVYAILQAGAADAQTRTPRDSGFLSQSQYAPQIEITAGWVSGRIGYTAAYAAAVHEAQGTLAGQDRQNGNGQYWDPSGEPEYLERGFEAIESAIPAILKSVYHV